MKYIMAIVLSMLFVCFAGVSSETHAAPTDEGYSLEISDISLDVVVASEVCFNALQCTADYGTGSDFGINYVTNDIDMNLASPDVFLPDVLGNEEYFISELGIFNKFKSDFDISPHELIFGVPIRIENNWFVRTYTPKRVKKNYHSQYLTRLRKPTIL